MGMESISRVTAAQSYQANTAASQPAPVTNVEAIDTAQNKQADVEAAKRILKSCTSYGRIMQLTTGSTGFTPAKIQPVCL